MKFESYLNEGRTEAITKDKVKELVKTKFNNAFKIAPQIYRGIEKFKEDFGIVKPNLFERKSTNVNNYYTLMIDNLPTWKTYPKRSKSIICSSGISYAKTYGKIFVILPINNTNIGVCESFDIWETEINILPPSLSIDLFVETLDNLFVKFKIKKGYEEAGSDVTWNKLHSYIKEFDRKIKNDKDSERLLEEFGEEYERDFGILKKFPLEKLIKEDFTPTKLGFSLMNEKQVLPRDREVWVENECLLISRDIFEDFKNEN